MTETAKARQIANETQDRIKQRDAQTINGSIMRTQYLRSSFSFPVAKQSVKNQTLGGQFDSQSITRYIKDI